MKRTTIKEIAKKAGVSIGTVDRVLHNRGEVAAKTKDLILEIAKQGEYTTNVYARSLKLNKTFQIAVLLPNDNEYWKTQNLSITEAAAQYEPLGLGINFFTFDRQSQSSLNEQVHQVVESKPDGVILAPLIEDEITNLANRLEKLKIPFVFVDSNLDGVKPLSFIGQDSRKAGYLAAKLLTLGYPQDVKVYIGKFDDFDSLNKTIEERIEGFRNYFEANGFDSNLVSEMDLTEDNTDFLGEIEVLKQEEQPVLIFIPNSRSHQMSGLLREFIGLVRIVGFDLISENRDCLKAGVIDFIIDQNPSRQGELAVQSFYNKLILNIDVVPTQLMALEIFTKENLRD